MLKLNIFFNIFVLWLLVFTRAENQKFSVGNIFSSTKDIARGLASDVGNALPTPKGLFEGGKQLLIAYPFEFVSSTINKICSAAVSSETISPKFTPDISRMRFQFRTPCKNHTYPLLDADEMWKNPDFDPKKKVVIMVTGWISNANESETIDTVAKAYNCRGDNNFIALDSGGFVDTLYTWAAFNTEEIGDSLAKGLKELSQIVPVENIHLIGHSLGAHIVGSAGRTFTELTGKNISRITGLDPAKPCFNEGEDLTGLARGDADFVDVIHSNSGVLGKREPSGDIDFYPGGLDPLPPGCIDVSCAHARAWRYYAETVYPGSEYNFIGVRCSSLTKLRENKCKGKGYPMGYAVPHDLKGNYFLEVKGKAPHGEKANPTEVEKNKNCGLCLQ